MVYSIFLIIDTTSDECLVGTYDGHSFAIKKWRWALRGRKDTGGEVLHNIQKLLKNRQKNLDCIKGILVNQGPGSYTGTRVGITIANTLSWSSNIPVVGYTDKKTADIARGISRKIKNGQIPSGHFPTPRY